MKLAKFANKFVTVAFVNVLLVCNKLFPVIFVITKLFEIIFAIVVFVEIKLVSVVFVDNKFVVVMFVLYTFAVVILVVNLAFPTTSNVVPGFVGIGTTIPLGPLQIRTGADQNGFFQAHQKHGVSPVYESDPMLFLHAKLVEQRRRIGHLVAPLLRLLA